MCPKGLGDKRLTVLAAPREASGAMLSPRLAAGHHSEVS